MKPKKKKIINAYFCFDDQKSDVFPFKTILQPSKSEYSRVGKSNFCKIKTKVHKTYM